MDLISSILKEVKEVFGAMLLSSQLPRDPWPGKQYVAECIELHDLVKEKVKGHGLH